MHWEWNSQIVSLFILLSLKLLLEQRLLNTQSPRKGNTRWISCVETPGWHHQYPELQRVAAKRLWFTFWKWMTVCSVHIINQVLIQAGHWGFISLVSFFHWSVMTAPLQRVLCGSSKPASGHSWALFYHFCEQQLHAILWLQWLFWKRPR